MVAERTSRENEKFSEAEVRELVHDLEIRRYVDFQQTNGDMLEHIDHASELTAQRTKGYILELVKVIPETLPIVIDEIVKQGTSYKYIKYVTSIYHSYEFPEESWPDGELSLKMIVDTTVGVGEGALPYLEMSDKRFAKEMVRKLKLEKLKAKFKALLKKSK